MRPTKTQMPPRTFRGEPPNVVSGKKQDVLVGGLQPHQQRTLARQLGNQPAEIKRLADRS